MYFFLLFLSGVVLFYVFLFFPVTSIAVLFLTAAFLAFADRATNNTTLLRLLSLRLVRNPSDSRSNEVGFPTGGNDVKCGRTYTPLCKKRCLLILALIIGFAYAFFRYSPPLDLSSLSNRELIVNCIVDDLPQETSSGRYVNKVHVGSAFDAGSGDFLGALSGREMNIISGEGLRQGWKYQLFAKSGRGGERVSPGVMESEVPFAYLGEIWKAETVGGNSLSTWLRSRRESLHLHLWSIFDRDSAALLSSITIGETSGMSDELKTAFSKTGLAHLLSISGTHFGLFSMLVFGMFRLLILSIPYRFLQRVTVFLTPSQAAAIISLPFVFVYLFISGLSIPAVRSFIMINIFLLGLLIGRRGFWLNSLLLAAFLICLWDPSAVVNISFQLSFLAVLFIGFFVVEGKMEEVEFNLKD
ncbi:MAG TPA: ComEC/Rec2 family competence protein, partial [Thermodesulfovibrionales bacterium]|nr:ComEC/Rec2 family competence protein [Thermodesulfovibrionales bacterium]